MALLAQGRRCPSQVDGGTHMLHNCTARNFVLLGVFRCSAWHVVSEILRPIGRTAGNMAAEWSGPSAWASRKGAYQNWSRKCFRCSEATLPMIASVLGSSASEHRFRCSEALLPMVGCHHTQHCFQKAMAWTNRDVCFPKPCPNPMGGATNPWDASGDE